MNPNRPKNIWRPGDRRTPHARARDAAPELILTLEETALAAAVHRAGPAGLPLSAIRLSSALRLELARRIRLRDGRMVAP